MWRIEILTLCGSKRFGASLDLGFGRFRKFNTRVVILVPGIVSGIIPHEMIRMNKLTIVPRDPNYVRGPLIETMFPGIHLALPLLV